MTLPYSVYERLCRVDKAAARFMGIADADASPENEDEYNAALADFRKAVDGK